MVVLCVCSFFVFVGVIFGIVCDFVRFCLIVLFVGNSFVILCFKLCILFGYELLCLRVWVIVFVAVNLCVMFSWCCV